jgi:4-hydroxy-L-threonine phosphate dehydrogenase PdxA
MFSKFMLPVYGGGFIGNQEVKKCQYFIYNKKRQDLSCAQGIILLLALEPKGSYYIKEGGCKDMKPVLGILLGEAAGIGPELIAKVCAKDGLLPYCRPVLIGDARVLAQGQEIAGVKFPVTIIDDISEANWDGPLPMLDQKNLDPQEYTLGEVSAHSGRITGDMFVTALTLAQKGAIAGYCYGPVNKASLKLGGYNFEDPQRMFAHYLKWDKLFGEMNVLDNLWAFRVTSHIPLKDVCANVTTENVLGAIKLGYETMTRAGIEPRIAVSALNPHGGEWGQCGREEIEVIKPAVEQAQAEGINVEGPYPADTLFLNAFKGMYNAVVSMYHDQGQIATKLMGFSEGVTVGAGFPYAISTPAHGTAFDIAGKGVADTEAMERAIILAAQIAGWRK